MIANHPVQPAWPLISIHRLVTLIVNLIPSHYLKSPVISPYWFFSLLSWNTGHRATPQLHFDLSFLLSTLSWDKPSSQVSIITMPMHSLCQVRYSHGVTRNSRCCLIRWVTPAFWVLCKIGAASLEDTGRWHLWTGLTDWRERKLEKMLRWDKAWQVIGGYRWRIFFW